MSEFLIKSVLVMAALLAIYHLFLEREKMHRFNRFYLLLSLVFALALPFVSIPIYVEAEAAPEVAHVTETPVVETAHLLAAPAPTVSATPVIAVPEPEVNYWPYIILALYGTVTLVLTTRFVINITRFYRIRKKNETSIYNNATLVLVKDNVLPHTFLNSIYLSKADYESRRIEPELFTHELTHVKQRHTLDILFIEVLKILFWFNPLLYPYKRAIQLNHEFLADETTLQHHFNVSAYQHLLLGKAAPATAYALASSINFSITKKRFIMMTKTTNKAKSIVLKTALLPTAALLLYFLSTETITYTKTANSIHKTVVNRSTPIAQLMPDVITADAPEKKEDAAVAETSQQNTIDTTAGDARRAEYFKGVKIVIEDATRNVFVKMPFEKLPLEYRQYYLNGIPEKKVSKPISESDYEFTFKQKNAVYYIDEQKVTREEALTYKREDFYYNSFKAQGKSEPGGEFINHYQMFLFTKPFFEKKLKHLNDHYPDKVFTVAITANPEDTNKELIEAMNKRDASGKTASEVKEEKLQAKLKADKYNFTGKIAESNKSTAPQFPGGSQAFKTYLDSSFQLPEKYTERVLVLFTVNTDGSLSEVTATGLDDEDKQKAEQAVKASPRWIPAQKNGKAIKCDTSVYIKPQKK